MNKYTKRNKQIEKIRKQDLVQFDNLEKREVNKELRLIYDNSQALLKQYTRPLSLKPILNKCSQNFLYFLVRDMMLNQSLVNETFFKSVVEQVDNDNSYDKIDTQVFMNLANQKLNLLNRLNFEIEYNGSRQGQKDHISDLLCQFIALSEAQNKFAHIDELYRYGWSQFLVHDKYSLKTLAERILQSEPAPLDENDKQFLLSALTD